MQCINFKMRSKDYKKIFYCAMLKKEIDLQSCNKCPHKVYKFVKPMPRATKPIKQRTSKQAKAEKNRFSILTDDLTKCIECGRTNCNIQLHEVFYGRNRQASIKYGCVVPLCGVSCHNQYQSIGIHFDKELCLKWQINGQLECMRKYDMSVDEFIKIFGKNYLKWNSLLIFT